MKIVLYRMVSVINQPVKKIEIQGEFEDYYLGLDQINEELLLENLPPDFLPPIKLQEVSIMVEEEIYEPTGEPLGVTGQRNLTIFQNYCKQSLQYSLLFCRCNKQ